MTPSQQPTIWLVNGPILLLYVAAAVMFVLLRSANDRICSASSKEKPMPPAVIAALTFVSNLLGAASLVMLANALSSPTRLSMLALPLVLLVELYGRAIRREPENRLANGTALAGSVAGLVTGAWLFMRNAATADPLSHAAVPGDVPTIPLSELMRNERNWAVSVKLVVFYVISMAIFFSLHALLKAAAKKLMDCPAEKLKRRTALATLLAFALNFAGVAALIFMAKSSDVQTRLAMVGFPLFLISESYTKLLRAEPQNRPFLWTGLIGSSSGILLASFFLLRGAPLH
jgi:hypothetical protein